MTAKTHEAALRVVVSADKSAAELIVPPGINRQMITPELCESVLRDSGVEVTAQVRAAVKQVIASEQAAKAVVARATPPKHGIDGYVEWINEPDESSTPGAKPAAAPVAPAPPSADPQKTSYYEHSAFVMVKPGQVVGRLHPPTPGEDGRDVTGKTLPAKPGKEFRLKFDESLACDAAGKLVAQEEGVLVRDPNNAGVRRVLEIPSYVDFSTGNIDFHGDVLVGKGVRDLFTIKATGNVDVKGLIEAATILADGDLFARGGFAGRERGTARCGGVHAKYLDNVQGEVLRDLNVEREIINCDLVVHGNLEAPHGAIIGGRMAVTGKIHVGMLGSGAAVATEIIVGSVPRLEPLYQRLQNFVQQLQTKREAAIEEQTQLNRMLGKTRPTAQDKERQTELIFEIANFEMLLTKARPTLENLEKRINDQRTVDVTIERKLHPGVIVVIGRDQYHISTDMRGPLRIVRDAGGRLNYSRGDTPGGLLAQIADIEISSG